MPADAVTPEEPMAMSAGYRAPYCATRGGTRSACFHPDGYALWKLEGELDAGAELEWGADHGDEAIFVLSGELETDRDRCGEGGAVIVESGVPGFLRSTQDTRLLHFGPIETEPPSAGPFGPPQSEGHRMHVVPAHECAALRAGNMTFFADGGCPTCRAAFFMVDHRQSPEGRVGASHVHTEDEIIHVLDGTMQVGPVAIPAGRSVAIPAGRRYGYRTAGPLRFLNYRRDVSTFVTTPGSEPQFETRAAIDEFLARRAAHSG